MPSVFPYLYALCPEAVYLGQKVYGLHDRAVSDYGEFFSPEYPRRQEVEDELPVVYHYCVAGVLAALVPGHHIGALGKIVDELALALVSPLCPYYQCCRHFFAKPLFC
jgi:hypothetical protein